MSEHLVKNLLRAPDAGEASVGVARVTDNPFAAWWAAQVGLSGNHRDACRFAWDAGRSEALTVFAAALDDLRGNRDYWRRQIERERGERRTRDRNCGHGHDGCSTAVCFVRLGAPATTLPAWLHAAPNWNAVGRLTNPAEVPPLARLADAANGYGGQGTRALHCLANLFAGGDRWNRGIPTPTTLRDLVALPHSQMLRVRNMGPHALRRLTGAFAACGVTWPEGGLR